MQSAGTLYLLSENEVRCSRNARVDGVKMNVFRWFGLLVLVASIAALIHFTCFPQNSWAETDAITHLLRKLKSDDVNEREEAAWALGKSRDPRAVAPLLAVLQDRSEDGQVRMRAAMALGATGSGDAVEPLITFVREDMKWRTGLMAGCIGALGELKDPRAVPVLLEVLRNRADDWIYREMAARALGNIGDPRATDDLITAAYMADTRHDAIAALSKIGDAKAVEPLIEALDEEEEPSTAAAAKAGILNIGAPALPALIEKIEHFSAEYPGSKKRAAIAEILGQLCDIRAEAPLMKTAEKDSSPLVRKSALQALERLRDCEKKR
jgi:HEAT repeat protein